MVLDVQGYVRVNAVLDGDVILQDEELAGWFYECDCYYDARSSEHIFKVLDHSRKIEIQELYESRGHTATCTHAWEFVG